MARRSARFKVDDAVEVRDVAVLSATIVRIGKTVADVRLKSGRVERYRLSDVRPAPARMRYEVDKPPKWLKQISVAVWNSVLPVKKVRVRKSKWYKRMRG